MPFTRRTAALALATTLAGLAAEAALHPWAASAAPRPGPETPSVLVLTVDPLTTGAPRSTVLVCGPAGGSHPDPAGACRAVARVDGDLTALDADPGPCTLEHAPLTVHAWGYWQDRVVSYTRTFDNRCLLRRGTGALFDF